MSRSVLLIGGPDSGKTNFVGRVWPALEDGKGRLQAVKQPDDIQFVLEVADHLFSGHFAPRSEHVDDRRDFEVVVSEFEGEHTSIIIPDMSGELWQNAVLDCEVTPELMSEMCAADGAILFVRVGSDQDVRPLDWVSSQAMMEQLGEEKNTGLPTQVLICELIRFLELTLANRPNGGCPRLSVVVSAWDLVDDEKFAAGPESYLEKEYPFVAGRLKDLDCLDVQVFGLSVVGGDLKTDEEFRDKMLESGIDGHGWVAVKNESGSWEKHQDLTLPIAWVVGAQE